MVYLFCSRRERCFGRFRVRFGLVCVFGSIVLFGFILIIVGIMTVVFVYLLYGVVRDIRDG